MSTPEIKKEKKSKKTAKSKVPTEETPAVVVEEVKETPKVEEPVAVVEPVAEEPAVVEPAAVEPAVVEESKKTEEVVEEKKVEEEKKEEDVEMKEVEKEEPVVEEKPKDVEVDAAEDTRPRISKKVAFNSYDSTINVQVSEEGVVSSYQNSGLGQLVGCVRGNTGVKSGRYYYEVKVVDNLPSSQGRHEFRAGFSTLKADILGTGEGSFIFDSMTSSMYNNGEVTKNLPGSAGKKGRLLDVVGVLINRDASSELCNTMSLFVNGERFCEPQKITVDADVALYPTISVKGCSVLSNFSEIITPLEFKVRMLGDASQADVEESTVASPAEAEVVFPIGFATEEYVAEFAAKNPDFIVLDRKHLSAWAERSGVKNVQCTDDGGKCIGGMMRKRKFLVSLLDPIFPRDRKKLTSCFQRYRKTAQVIITENPRFYTNFSAIELPTEEDGFDAIEYVTPKEECEKILKDYKDDCKLRSRVDDLKVGTFFKEKMDEFKKLMNEKRADKEADTEWAAEDYLLATLRAEIHYLLHAFKADVNDETRLGFASTHLAFYYKLYASKGLDFSAFGCKQPEDLLELLSDVFSIDEKTLLLPVLEKEIEAVKLLELTEESRRDRQDRLDAGDENAALKFSANRRPNNNNNRLQHIPNGGKTNQNKGAPKGGRPQVVPRVINNVAPVHQMRTIPGGVKRQPPPQSWNPSAKRQR